MASPLHHPRIARRRAAERSSPRRALAALLTLTAAALLAGGAAAAELRDPTRPPESYVVPPAGTVDEAPGEIVEWHLTATYTNRNRRRAVINGHHVSEGEKINDAEVLTIRPGRVQLREGDEVFSLTIYTDTIRRPAAGNLRS
ncbi:hypothetical protein [Endothiovibrio diazotrophicus]